MKVQKRDSKKNGKKKNDEEDSDSVNKCSFNIDMILKKETEQIQPPPQIKNNLGKKRLTLFFKNTNGTHDLVEMNGFIGRDKSNFIPIFDKEHKEVSRKHCEIVYEQNGYFLRDNGSTNGTYVLFPNGIELYVKNGTTIMMGSYMYEFQEVKDISEPGGKQFKVLQFTEDWRRVDRTFDFDLAKNEVLVGNDPICHLSVLDDEKMQVRHAHITANTKLKMLAIKALSNSG